MKLPKHMKIAAGCMGAAIFGILFGWVLFPVILKSQLKKEMALSKKTDVRKMWETIPFALDFKVYLFNYTNHDEVQKGAIPIVKEVGPYYFELGFPTKPLFRRFDFPIKSLFFPAVFGIQTAVPLILLYHNTQKCSGQINEEWKEKVELQDNEDTDTVSYKKRDTFYFKKTSSGPGLTGEEEIILPHVFMLSLATIVSRDKPAMLNMLGKAFNGIFDSPESIFMKVKPLDLLFRGVNINCARTEFAPKAVCTAIKKEAADRLVFEPNNQYKFSLFGMRNGTIDKHVVTVSRGIKNVMDVGKVVAIDNKTEQDVWRDTCNKLEGTDGTVFPPFLTEFDRLESFAGDLCRTFKPAFQKKTAYRGIKTNRYIANIGDLANDPELQCYCESPEKCPPKGLMDLTKCMGAPLYVSMPHYYDSDPELLKTVKGLAPDVNEHEIVIDFEPITGTPMVAKQRIQFSLRLIQTDKMDLFKELPNTMAPIFWIEEGLALNKTFVKMLKNQLFIPKRIVGVVRWLLVASGLLGALGCLVFHFKDNIMRFAVTTESPSKVKPEPESNGQMESPPKIEI